MNTPCFEVPAFVELKSGSFVSIEEATDQQLRSAERRLRKQALQLTRDADALEAVRKRQN